MSVDYSKKYRPHQLEPFFPNEMIKMVVSVLGTMAAIMAIVLLFPEAAEEPANPRVTPPHIKPEWYFLAVYQYLKLMPPTLLGISGKILGVMSQGAVFLVLLTVPFWYRKRSGKPPGLAYHTAVTLILLVFLALTLWGLWPSDSQGNLVPMAEYYHEHHLFILSIFGMVIFFYVMLWWEHLEIKKRWYE